MRYCHQQIAFHDKQSDPASFSVLQETPLLKLIYTKINKHSANHNECAEIFFQQPKALRLKCWQ